MGQWNHCEIKVEGKRIRIYLNDRLVNDFTSTDDNRLKWPSHVGLQNDGGGENVHYCDVQVKELADPENVPAEVTDTAPEQVETGRKAAVVVEVGSAAEEPPTGMVVLSVDGTEPPSVELEDGKAVFTIGALGKPRTVELVATYSGDAAVKPGCGTARIEVVTPASIW